MRADLSDGDFDKEENFYILKHTNCPAIFTENFFNKKSVSINYSLKRGKEFHIFL